MRIWLTIALLVGAVAGVAAAAPANSKETALQFLQNIYSHYLGDDRTAKGIFLDKPADIRRYFVDDLANMIIADDEAAAKAGDVPNLDGDPFIDAQDWDIKNLSVHIDSQDAQHAAATVHFENVKQPITIHLSLVETPRGWRIWDIVWPDDEGTFRGLYKKK